MTIDQAIQEWKSKQRRMGCVAATDWFCKKVTGFWPERLTRYTENGEVFQHVIATDGVIRIDLAPFMRIDQQIDMFVLQHIMVE